MKVAGRFSLARDHVATWFWVLLGVVVLVVSDLDNFRELRPSIGTVIGFGVLFALVRWLIGEALKRSLGTEPAGTELGNRPRMERGPQSQVGRSVLPGSSSRSRPRTSAIGLRPPST